MSEQSTSQHRAVEALASGDHISDANGVHRVMHTFDFHDGDGSPSTAVTLQPLGHGQPWIARHKRRHELRLATDTEITAYRELDKRNSLASGLNSLAHLIQDQQLPIDFSYFSIVLNTPEQVAEWAKAGGVTARENCGHLIVDFQMGGLSVHAQAKLPAPAEAVEAPRAAATPTQQAGE